MQHRAIFEEFKTKKVYFKMSLAADFVSRLDVWLAYEKVAAEAREARVPCAVPIGFFKDEYTVMKEIFLEWADLPHLRCFGIGSDRHYFIVNDRLKSAVYVGVYVYIGEYGEQIGMALSSIFSNHFCFSFFFFFFLVF